MKLMGAAFALGLLVLVIWFMVQIERPGPNVGELDGLAILRLLDGEVGPPEYCQRRGMAGADDELKEAMRKLAKGYGGFGPAARASISRVFFGVAPGRQAEYDRVQKFIGALQKNRNLVIEPSFRAELVLISEFMATQCRQLAQAQLSQK